MSRRPLALLLVPLAVLTGCSSPVDLPPGPFASDPTCGEVLISTPDELGGLERRSTSAQATTAWGDPAVTLRCGVEPHGPTTDRCLSVDSGDGSSVDWIALEGDDPSLPEHTRPGRGSWAFVTYGRDPAIEVVVPAEQGASGQPTAYLVDLAGAVDASPAERSCVGATDVS
ncbi:uncharacterized protein DUF3515 [Georgenia soli]|uniref:Uncharacterized protein DUF3515 n=1 Tax=Georgenia soli TaxID=638953 RepID=A0A2A9EQP1_9MICO|nr:DUF3515 family protein [Georgenia soli]PFG40841.1 uncharacterized protein DUF3515 [Georgenia soli]